MLELDNFHLGEKQQGGERALTSLCVGPVWNSGCDLFFKRNPRLKCLIGARTMRAVFARVICAGCCGAQNTSDFVSLKSPTETVGAFVLSLSTYTHKPGRTAAVSINNPTRSRLCRVQNVPT